MWWTSIIKRIDHELQQEVQYNDINLDSAAWNENDDNFNKIKYFILL
jgi:hypothetical protein